MTTDLAGARVLVVGFGRSGRSAARLALARGARVVAVDLGPDADGLDGVTLELGPHRPERFHEADVIVVSPGVPASQPDVAAAVARGTDVVGELGFAARYLTGPIAAVTGTNGKSTTTHFLGQLLARGGLEPFVGGNLGTPLCDAVLAGRQFGSFAVEVSSYQLELPGTFHPKAGVILNLTPDHLGRHGSMEGYAAAKARLFEHMDASDLAVLPDDALLRAAADRHGGTRAWLGAHPGVIRTGRSAAVRLASVEATFDLAPVTVPGAHNLDNAAAAALLALALGAPVAAVQDGLADLRALPHRMQIVAHAGGVWWIDDSKATNLDAARVGISGLERPAVVLLGGQGKPGADGSLGFGALASVLGRHRAVVAFGDSGPVIAAELGKAGVGVTLVTSLDDAVACARDLAQSGEAVLLSPGCASFDAFRNFEHRGEVFAALARGRST
jgi:UDP-N-acetylmuramoylalanine--D-glutamate ligase